MKFSILSAILVFAAAFLVSSCSEPVVNSDLKEYGYKGQVKSITSKTYRGLEQKDGEWVLEPDKISAISELTFNENGNITKVKTTFPRAKNDTEMTYFQFKDDRKSSYFKVNVMKDTIETGTYKWKNDFEYDLIISRPQGERIESGSKLNDNYRDLSGGYKYVVGDSIVYAKSYANALDKNGRITQITFNNDITKEKNTMSMTYEDIDSKGNPQKVILVEDKTGELDNLSVREFTYFE